MCVLHIVHDVHPTLQTDDLKNKTKNVNHLNINIRQASHYTILSLQRTVIAPPPTTPTS